MAKCRECGHSDWIEKVLEDFETDVFGILANIRHTVIEKTCSHCDAKKYTLPRDGKVEAALAMARVLIPIKLFGHEIRFLRNTVGMSGKEFATKVAGKDPATLSRWENDSQSAGGYADMVIRQKIAALLHDRAPAISYDPKMFVGMEIIEGAPVPTITLEPVQLKLASEKPISQEWEAHQIAA
jgi:DNA-binding transcriptional regulator YiaG